MARDTVSYGSHPDQYIDVTRPTGDPRWTAVLVHGGYWRSPYKADLMEPMAEALAASGVTAWNVEYRRPDAHGWEATTSDLAAALAAVVPDGPVVVIGHSAGGQLALRAAADAAPAPALAVSLAGVIDLEEAHRLRLGDGAVENALGHPWDAGNPDDVASSPRHRLPLRVPQVIACGHDDDPHLLAISRDYARAAGEAGDDLVQVSAPGDHFDIIAPQHRLWSQVLAAIEHRVAG
ncbi:alpha/beta hydrolase [Williamsia deligens]|uniref:Alpha/beta hydrolase n=1 Tax=Williamsia deligens TaxID=321325 RepID=A0ABW3G7P6_9NOCA|nr:alpha/beta fold hydrolase [Williamsia deligens]MCP2192745.1 Alpha/beta hydrolase family protein [Williamsia deligens]